MNIAPLAVFIFLLSIPGIIFIETCRTGTKGFPSRKINFIERIAFSFIWSILLHYTVHKFWIYIGKSAFYSIGFPIEHIKINEQAIIALVIAGRGNNNNGTTLHSSIQELSDCIDYSICYIIIVCLIAAPLGILANHLFANRKIVRLIFGIRADWHHRIFPHLYIKKNEDDLSYRDIMPSIAFTVELGNNGYLYKGIIDTYDYKSIKFDTNGELDTLQLKHVCRRPITDDDHKLSDYARSERYRNVPGDVFVAKYSTIKTLSISYIVANSQTSKGVLEKRFSSFIKWVIFPMFKGVLLLLKPFRFIWNKIKIQFSRKSA